MRVILPREATGAEIAEAVKKAAEHTGFSCKLNTENAFVAGSVKEVPLRHSPELSKKTGHVWGKTKMLVGSQGGSSPSYGEPYPSKLDNDAIYHSIEVQSIIPFLNVLPDTERIAKTTDRSFWKVEPYFKEFVGALFEELEPAG